MRYEELREQFEEFVEAGRQCSRLLQKAKCGRLPPDRLAACNQEISDLRELGKRFCAKMKRLKQAEDPAWAKLTRELDATMHDYATRDENPTSLFQKVRGFVGTVSMLILGTWMIDSWRRK